MHLYAITNRRLFANREALIGQAVAWAKGGVDYIQIREKDLSVEDSGALAGQIVKSVRQAGGRTRVLLNGPVEIALAAGCDGLHLPSNLPGTAIAEARNALAGMGSELVISVSCHTVAEIEHARVQGAALALFAPVFEKQTESEIVPGSGLAMLAEACRMAHPMPVFALGGIHASNAGRCIEAGAAGIAAIRLFASGEWLELRASSGAPS